MGNPLMTTPREKKVPLLPGDYQDRISALAEQIDEAESQAQSDKRKRAVADKLAQEIDALRDAANVDGAVVVTVREIPEVKKRQLQDDCPPRKGNKRDEIYGYDEDAYATALVRASLVDPAVTDEQFDEWRATVSAPNFKKIRDAAFDVNEREVNLGKQSAVLLLRQARGDASRQQDDTE